MADTPRTLAALQTLLADNTAGDISAQDVRDFLVSVYQPQGVCDFRLGLEDGVFVSSTDQTAKSNIYLNSSGRGNRFGLTDGTSWQLFTFPKLALGGLTGLTSARNYDCFVAFSTPTHSSTNTGTDVVTWTANPGWTTGTYVYVLTTGGGLTAGTDYWYNRASSTTGSFHTTLANAIAGTSKVDLTGNITQTLIGVYMDLGPTWNAGAGAGSDTARGTGAGSTALTTLNGVNVNGVSVTGSIGAGTIAASSGVYAGSIRTTGTTTTEDSFGQAGTSRVGGKAFVFNAHNRINRKLKVIFSTSTYTYNTATIRQAEGQGGNKVEYLHGLVGDDISAELFQMLKVTGGGYGYIGIGLDSITAFSGLYADAYNANAAQVDTFLVAYYAGNPGLGYHYVAWLENGGASTCTRTGINTGSDVQAGLVAEVIL